MSKVGTQDTADGGMDVSGHRKIHTLCRKWSEVWIRKSKVMYYNLAKGLVSHAC